MSLLDEVGEFLDAQFPELLLPDSTPNPDDGNLYLSDLPDNPDFGVAVFQYAGSTPIYTMGGTGVPVIEQPRIQILVRDYSYAIAMEWSYKIWKELGKQADATLSGTKYLRIMCLDSPSEIGPDSRDRQRIVANYSVWKEVSNA